MQKRLNANGEEWIETPTGWWTDMDKDELEEKLVDLIYRQNWKYAKTYDKSAPHEYIVFSWNKDLFYAIGHFIDLYGWDTKFYKHDVRYGFIGNYRYWHYHTYVHNSIMNRARNVPEHMGYQNYTPELREKYMKSGYVRYEA